MTIYRIKELMMEYLKHPNKKIPISVLTLHPHESISENSSDEEETNETSFRPGLLVSSTIMVKNKTIWKRAPASVFGRINAKIMYEKSTGKTMSRREFLLQLIENLHHTDLVIAASATPASSATPIPNVMQSSRKRRKRFGSGTGVTMKLYHCV